MGRKWEIQELNPDRLASYSFECFLKMSSFPPVLHLMEDVECFCEAMWHFILL